MRQRLLYQKAKAPHIHRPRPFHFENDFWSLVGQRHGVASVFIANAGLSQVTDYEGTNAFLHISGDVDDVIVCLLSC